MSTGGCQPRNRGFSNAISNSTLLAKLGQERMQTAVGGNVCIAPAPQLIARAGLKQIVDGDDIDTADWQAIQDLTLLVNDLTEFRRGDPWPVRQQCKEDCDYWGRVGAVGCGFAVHPLAVAVCGALVLGATETCRYNCDYG